MMKRLKTLLLILLCTIFFTPETYSQVLTKEEQEEEKLLKEFDLYSFKDAQTKIKDSTVLYQHLIGVKYGYAMSNVAFSTSGNHKGIKSSENYGVYYTYLHSMLNNMPYFGFQTGISRSVYGYTHVSEISENEFREDEQVYYAAELPLIAIFRVDIKKVRLMLGVGGYASYIYDTELPGGIPETTNDWGMGIIGQGGIALVFHPIELHFECSYKYGLSHFLDPKIYSEDYWLYTHPTQLQVSAGIHFRLGGKYNKRK